MDWADVTVVTTQFAQYEKPDWTVPVPLGLDTRTLRPSWEEMPTRPHCKCAKTSSCLLQGFLQGVFPGYSHPTALPSPSSHASLDTSVSSQSSSY